jgi:hypothetical protein
MKYIIWESPFLQLQSFQESSTYMFLFRTRIPVSQLNQFQKTQLFPTDSGGHNSIWKIKRQAKCGDGLTTSCASQI